MGRLDLSGTEKLPGQMGDGRVIRCDTPQPEVQFTGDGCIIVIKRDDINLTWRGRKHRQTLINIIRCCSFCRVSTVTMIEGNLEEWDRQIDSSREYADVSF